MNIKDLFIRFEDLFGQSISKVKIRSEIANIGVTFIQVISRKRKNGIFRVFSPARESRKRINVSKGVSHK